MRVSLAWLKDYLDLKGQLSVFELCNALTMAGLEVEEVSHFAGLNGDSELDSAVLTFGITPNRADALSHLGVARELCALLDLNMRSPMLTPKEMAGPTHERVTIEIEDEDDCPRYSCRVIEGLKVDESPMWLKSRLLACGINPINNVVDVCNYVMLSRGQPMHAFDYDKLSKEGNRVKIFVRKFVQEKDEFVALDASSPKLSADDLLICDQSGPIALAGVIGGLNSSVSKETSTILLESAYFSPKNIRMSSRRLGLSTESSFRFERGIDPNAVVDSLNYAARLLVEICPESRVCREPIDAYRKRIEPIEVKLRPERARDVLGFLPEQFDEDLLRRKFLGLGIETIAKRGDAIYFRIPTFRMDLTREIDLIEEAARMIGYEKIIASNISSKVDNDSFINKPAEKLIENISSHLVARGFSEAINYAFLNREFVELFIDKDQKDKLIEIKNPMSARFSVMRPTLIPGLINNLMHNLHAFMKTICLFESGTVFLRLRSEGQTHNPNLLSYELNQDSFCLEEPRIAGIIAGEQFSTLFGPASGSFDFYHIKGIVEECLKLAGLSVRLPKQNVYFEQGSTEAYLHPGASATIYLTPTEGQKPVALGVIGLIHPNIKEKIDITLNAFVFELDVKKIAEVMTDITKYQAFSRFPAIVRDVAFVANEETKIAELLNIAKDINGSRESLVDISVFDIYRGPNIGYGKKSVAISLKLQKSDRTLKDEEADSFVHGYIEAVKEKTGAHIR